MTLAPSACGVNRETLAEQLLYEVGDPARYLTPDVVAGLAEMSKRKSSVTLTTWRGSAAESRQEQLLGEASDLFSAAEVGEFGHGQVRTADSLLATIGTHSHLLVMDEAERAALIARTGDFLRSQPETAHGEFTLPMVTVVLRVRRR